LTLRVLGVDLTVVKVGPAVEIVRSPWRQTLLDAASRTRERLRIASPYIKSEAARSVLEAMQTRLPIDVLTDFHLRSFEAGASDLGAFDLLFRRGATVRHRSRLHAKLYVFDTQQVIVTSGNLTPSGLSRNLEYGVALRDPDLVERIANEFDSLFSARRTTSPVTSEIMTDARAILEQIPRRDRGTDRRLAAASRRLLEREPEAESRVFQSGSETVLAGLTGWKQEVFRLLDQSDLPERFALEDAYRFESTLARKFPQNANIKPKIRQTLQYLRDLGLLEFVGRGEYRKLWTS
jgi:phosphatidylserine/phosphatidylglycerophosphate/cardiolipin synthase-like enzyme